MRVSSLFFFTQCAFNIILAKNLHWKNVQIFIQILFVLKCNIKTEIRII